jgi:hypothetical protein
MLFMLTLLQQYADQCLKQKIDFKPKIQKLKNLKVVRRAGIEPANPYGRGLLTKR